MNTKTVKTMVLATGLSLFFANCNNNKQPEPEANVKSEIVVANSNGENTIQIVAINGSPRDTGNTAVMCRSFLDGAKSSNEKVETTLINLYDIDFKGCTSCFACKRDGGESYGKCAMQDGLTPVLEKIAKADGLVIGSPIYMSEITGEVRSFMERLIFQYSTYESPRKILSPKRIPTAMIYTMNVTKEGAEKSGYNEYFDREESLLARVFQRPVRICAYNTYQFDDYSKYKANAFSESEKRQYKETQFPVDCQIAFDAGKQMVETILN